jgi:chemotaxis protein MotB
MALGTRRSRRSSIDIWPGFVDALAQLLMVIIFVLLVFTAGQFLLSDALSGRGRWQLQQQVNELGDLLAVEKRRRGDYARARRALTTQLQAAMAERDTLRTSSASWRRAPTRGRPCQ